MGAWEHSPPRLRLRGRGLLALIRDRECRHPFCLLLPAVPLLPDVLEHRFEIGQPQKAPGRVHRPDTCRHTELTRDSIGRA